MTTKTHARHLGPLLTAAGVFVAVLIGAAIGPVTETAEVPATTPRIEADPAPGAQIDRDLLTPAERTFLTTARTWGTEDLDTTMRTDVELLKYGRTTCDVLEAVDNSRSYRQAMDTAQGEAGGPMTHEDAVMLEAAAVNAWCPSHIGTFGEFTG